MHRFPLRSAQSIVCRAADIVDARMVSNYLSTLPRSKLFLVCSKDFRSTIQSDGHPPAKCHAHKCMLVIWSYVRSKNETFSRNDWKYDSPMSQNCAHLMERKIWPSLHVADRAGSQAARHQIKLHIMWLWCNADIIPLMYRTMNAKFR